MVYDTFWSFFAKIKKSHRDFREFKKIFMVRDFGKGNNRPYINDFVREQFIFKST